MSGPLSSDAVDTACQNVGLLFPRFVIEQLVAALDTGKHVILTGPPGTGKTTLAHVTAEVARASMLCTGFLPTTATSEWTTFETIGGLQPTGEGLIFRPGLFIEAIESGRWLVIDELNRSNFDRAFGQLFTVLSGSAVVLPFKRQGRSKTLSLVPSGAEVPDDTDPIRVPANWRIIATMNMLDKNLLYEMSYALMRRFAFIEVAAPDDSTFHRLLQGDGYVVAKLLPLRRFADLGPAVYLDAARYAARRTRDAVSESRVLYEAFYAYFLPQLDGLDDRRAHELYRTMAALLEEPERREVARTVSNVVGVDVGV